MTDLNAVDTPVVELTRDLIQRQSVTPEDAGCQALLADRLEKLGFTIEWLNFGEVINLYAHKSVGDGPHLMLLGHTDVVPTGPEDAWDYPPFGATIVDGTMYGRGTADMKGSVAAFVTAIEGLLADNEIVGKLSFVMTSDEEGPSIDGVRKIAPLLQERGELPDYCLVGEPSSTSRIGDVVKNGRRGSLSGDLKVLGIQGHIAYPHLAENPIHTAAPALAELVGIEWDQGNEFFPQTSFQISNINAGTGANNVIPGHVDVQFNFRFSTEVTEDELRTKTHEVLDRHGVKYELNWHLSGLPFLTPEGPLVDAIQNAIRSICGIETELSTAGGTSDGRFLGPLGVQVVELGPLNATIHKVNECVTIAELNTLHLLYQDIIKQILVK